MLFSAIIIPLHSVKECTYLNKLFVSFILNTIVLIISSNKISIPLKEICEHLMNIELE